MNGYGALQTLRNAIEADDASNPDISTAKDLSIGGHDLVLEISFGGTDPIWDIIVLTGTKDLTGWNELPKFTASHEDGDIQRFIFHGIGARNLQKVQVRVFGKQGTSPVITVKGYSANL